MRFTKKKAIAVRNQWSEKKRRMYLDEITKDEEGGEEEKSRINIHKQAVLCKPNKFRNAYLCLLFIFSVPSVILFSEFRVFFLNISHEKWG